MVAFDQHRIDALETEFINLAFALFRNGARSQSYKVCDRRIRAWCGCSPLVIAKTWDLLERGGLHERASKERLLWALHLLTAYSVEETASAFCKCSDEGTFRHWAWYFIDEISYLESHVVSRRVSVQYSSLYCLIECLAISQRTFTSDSVEQSKEK